MKKILLASAALALSAGVAHAQAVTIGGQGRMGVQYSNGGYGLAGGGTSNWRTESRLQFNFSVAVQADHGLSFGGFTRLRLNTGVVQIPGTDTLMGSQLFSGHRVWVEAGGLRLTFGNQDGAIATSGTAMGYIGGCGIGYEGGQICGDTAGLLGAVTRFNSDSPHVGDFFGGRNTGGDQTLHARYTMGDWQAAISGERSNGVEVAVRGRIDAFTVAAGFQQERGVSPRVATVSAHYNGGTWGVGAIVARISVAGVGNTNYVINANADLGGGNLYGYVGRVNTNNAYGLSYSYGLGGGASITAGAERVGATTTGSVGVAFNF